MSLELQVLTVIRSTISRCHKKYNFQMSLEVQVLDVLEVQFLGVIRNTISRFYQKYNFQVSLEVQFLAVLEKFLAVLEVQFLDVLEVQFLGILEVQFLGAIRSTISKCHQKYNFQVSLEVQFLAVIRSTIYKCHQKFNFLLSLNVQIQINQSLQSLDSTLRQGISCGLAQTGFNVYKLVPTGSVDEVNRF